MHDYGVDICIIEDDVDQQKLLARQFAVTGYSMAAASCGVEGLKLIQSRHPRIVICDVVLPQKSGIQVCREVRDDPALDGTYFILVTAFHDVGHKLVALEAGADDYIRKPFSFEEMRARIHCGMRYHRLHERLRQAAVTDGLTELWNHTQFRELMDREFARTRRYGGTLSLLMLDLDHFKSINDSFGHETGNAVLRATARYLRQAVRDIDLVARYGGEEFAVICPQTEIESAAHLAERLRAGLPQAVHVPGHDDHLVYASLGVGATSDPRVTNVSDLINITDQGLYEAKRRGRNRVARCDEDQVGGHIDGELRVDEVDRLRKEVHTLSLQTKEVCLQSVWALIQALETRDGYSACHSRNVSVYTEWLAQAAGWSPPLITAVRNAAMLHDLGKIGVPDGLLLKPRPLSETEWAILRRVPLITCKILEPLRVFETEIHMIRHIRERFDGGGYPDGLVGESIPLGSRMLSVTEAFDSLTCNRAYRPGHEIDDALAILRHESGTQFDPRFVELICEQIRAGRDRWEARVLQARTQMPIAEAHAVIE